MQRDLKVSPHKAVPLTRPKLKWQLLEIMSFAMAFLSDSAESMIHRKNKERRKRKGKNTVGVS